MKIYTYLNDFEPFKYPDVKAEDLRLRKLLKN